MKKILHYGLSGNLGGIETFIFNLSSKINKEEYKFDFLILGYEKPAYYNELSAMGFGFHFVTPRRENPLKNIKDIKEIFIEEEYDVFHSHSNSLSYVEAINVASDLGIPTIIHSHNANISASPLSKILHNINYHRLPKKKVTKVAVSNEAGDWMFGRNSDFHIVNNGVNIEKFKYNNNSRKKIRSSFNFNEHDEVIIHVGAFRNQKNHKFIIDTFDEYLKINDNAKLLLVGTGSLENQIKEKIKVMNLWDQIILTGQRDDIHELLSAADTFLLPSLHEGFPIVAVEAQAAGLKCLISDVITHEVVINENCEIMSLESSPEEWAHALAGLQSFEDRRQGALNIEKAGLSLECQTKKIEKIYDIW